MDGVEDLSREGEVLKTTLRKQIKPALLMFIRGNARNWSVSRRGKRRRNKRLMTDIPTS